MLRLPPPKTQLLLTGPKGDTRLVRVALYCNKSDEQYRFELLTILLYALAQSLPRAKVQ